MISLFLAKHFQWTEKTFGSGLRTKGITNHIRKELEEIEAEPYKLEEWIDVLLLAFDGARRTGATPIQILQALEDKHYKVKERTYPFPTSEDEVSEHIREPKVCDRCSEKVEKTFRYIEIDLCSSCYALIEKDNFKTKGISPITEIKNSIEKYEFLSKPTETFIATKTIIDNFEFMSPFTPINYSQKGLNFIKFAAQVLNHIENYTIAQYGDTGNSQVDNWSIEMCLEQAKKYINRYGKNQREEQEMLDFMKAVHYLQFAATKYEESKGVK